MEADKGYMCRLLNGDDKKCYTCISESIQLEKEWLWIAVKWLVSVYEKGSQTYFFGSIVYVANNLGGYTEYIIIDGQQRITTVSLLLCTISNYLMSFPCEGVMINTKKITAAYLTDEYAEDEKKLKLKLIEGDDYAYDQLLKIILHFLDTNKEINSSIAAKLLKVEIKTASRLLLKAEKLDILNSYGKTKNKVYFRE